VIVGAGPSGVSNAPRLPTGLPEETRKRADRVFEKRDRTSVAFGTRNLSPFIAMLIGEYGGNRYPDDNVPAPPSSRAPLYPQLRTNTLTHECAIWILATLSADCSSDSVAQNFPYNQIRNYTLPTLASASMSSTSPTIGICYLHQAESRSSGSTMGRQSTAGHWHSRYVTALAMRPSPLFRPSNSAVGHEPIRPAPYQGNGRVGGVWSSRQINPLDVLRDPQDSKEECRCDGAGPSGRDISGFIADAANTVRTHVSRSRVYVNVNPADILSFRFV